MILKRSVLLFFIACQISACANVAQIDRGRLAKPIMQLQPMGHQQKFVNEMHVIREGAAGGTGQNAGGGCGCN